MFAIYFYCHAFIASDPTYVVNSVNLFCMRFSLRTIVIHIVDLLILYFEEVVKRQKEIPLPYKDGLLIFNKKSICEKRFSEKKSYSNFIYLYSHKIGFKIVSNVTNKAIFQINK